MTEPRDREQSNRRLAAKLAVVTVAMFGFGYALSPLYDLMCQAFGLNGKTGRVEEPVAQRVDKNRTVTVEFTGLATSGLPWEFRPLTKKIDVHPGETGEISYRVRNLAEEEITGQAVPSVSPGISAVHFNKIECFCFTQQVLKPGEARDMPVRFVIDPRLGKDVRTITLSYSFFNTNKLSAIKYGGAAMDRNDEHASHHVHPATASGG